MKLSNQLKTILLVALLISFPIRRQSGTSVFALNSQIKTSESNTVVYLPVALKQCNLLLNFDIGEGVPLADLNLIRSGLCSAQVNLREAFGGDIPDDLKHLITVKIVATGEGNQEPGGGGACCTGLDETGARPFFDVAHAHWEGNRYSPGPWAGEINLQKIAAHEYNHGWQNTLGCYDFYNQPMGDWLNEGIAEFVAYNAFIRQGYMTDDEARTALLNIAVSNGEVDVPLESLEGPFPVVWPGDIGYIAVEKLVMDSTLNSLSLRFICEQIRDGVSPDQAFENAFGITKTDFYEAFPSYLDSLLNP